MSKFKISDYKKVIKDFKANNMNYYDYYKHILLYNEHKWLFVDPKKCKPSFNNIHKNLQFLVLKNLIKKHSYKISVYKSYSTVFDKIECNKNYKTLYSLDLK